jgi:serine/threonine protein kinase
MWLQEYAGQGDLWAFIDSNGGRLPERVTVSLVLQPFLRALQFLHSSGIMHR